MKRSIYIFGFFLHICIIMIILIYNNFTKLKKIHQKSYYSIIRGKMDILIYLKLINAHKL